MNVAIKIVIADDHELIRTGFRRVVENSAVKMELIAEARNGEELIRIIEKDHPHIAVTDVRMPLMDGIQASKLIFERFPSTKVIAYSMFDDTDIVMRMIQAGALGYIVKTGNREEIIEAIQTVYLGEFYYCSTVSHKIFGTLISSKQKRSRNKPLQFSAQEIKIIRYICRELTSKEIATQLNLAVRTVDSYRQNIQEKMGARNAVGIALYAILHEIVKLGELM